MNAPLADLQCVFHDDAVVATVSGEIDVSNAVSLGAAIAEATSNQAGGVVLDLSAVEYIDSAGIHLIYNLRQRLQVRGQFLRLVVPAASPSSHALRLAGVTGHVGMAETLDDALAAAG